MEFSQPSAGQYNNYPRLCGCGYVLVIAVQSGGDDLFPLGYGTRLCR